MLNSEGYETVADIIREMRGAWDATTPTAEDLAIYADRLEAAAKRERTAHINDIHNALYAATGLPGNAAAMREALTGRDMALARGEINDIISDCNAALSCETCEAKNVHIRVAKSAAKEVWSKLDDLIRAALSAPTRNCDVGTEKEQHERFVAFCNSHGDCLDCPIKAEWHKALSCGILWGQMPYEAKEGGAE